MGLAQIQAGEVVAKVLRREGSVRGLCFAAKIKNKRAVYALVCETLRFNGVIGKLLKSMPVLGKRIGKASGYGHVLVYVEAIEPYKEGISKAESAAEAVESALKGKGELVDAVRQSCASLRSLVKHLIRQKQREAKNLSDDSARILLPDVLRYQVVLPRYVRVNSIKCTVEEALKRFQREGHRLVEASAGRELLTKMREEEMNPMDDIAAAAEETVTAAGGDNGGDSAPAEAEETAEAHGDDEGDDDDDGSDDVAPGAVREDRRVFWQDEHVPGLLVFPPATDLHAHPWVGEGRVLLQDKASCFSAHALLHGCTALDLAAATIADATPDSYLQVADACAAPGSKTTHLAALIFEQTVRKGMEQELWESQQRLMATDKDSERLELLKMMLGRAGALGCASARRRDFLSISVKDRAIANVTHLLVDPSCSGSGIVNRLDALLDATTSGGRPGEKKRLVQLSRFQFKIVSAALKFPNVQRVVYSTCSIHEIENERVVESLLAHNPEFELAEVLPSWPHRGHDSTNLPNGHLCVRASPDDFTNGFFVSCFKRKALRDSPDEEAEAVPAVVGAVAAEANVAMEEADAPGPPALGKRPAGDAAAQVKKKRKRKKKGKASAAAGPISTK